MEKVCVLILLGMVLCGLSQAAIGPIGDPNASNGWDTTSAVSVKASHTYASPISRAWVNIINGSGIYVLDGNEVHDIWVDEMAYALMDHPSGETRPGVINDGVYGDRWIMFSFDKPYLLDSIAIWIYNENGRGDWACFSLKDVYIEVSLTGGTNSAEWSPVAQLSLELSYPYNPGTPIAQSIPFGGVAARYVAITLKNGPEGTYVNNMLPGSGNESFGLSEVRFYGDEVAPEFCGEQGTVYLLMDFNKDCYVDFKDFAKFALQWLNCTDPAITDCDSYWK